MSFRSARRSCATHENCRIHSSCQFRQRATDRVRVDHHRRFEMDPVTGIPGSARQRFISRVTRTSAPLAIRTLRRCEPGSVPAATAARTSRTTDHASSRWSMPPHGDSTAGPDTRTLRHLHAQGAASRHPDQVLVELSTTDRRAVLRSNLAPDQPTPRTPRTGPSLRSNGRDHSVSDVAWRMVTPARVNATDAGPRVPTRTEPARRSRRCPGRPTY